VPPSVVAIAPGEPFAVETFSGISAGLLGALAARGALAGAVNGRPRWLERVEQAASFDPDPLRWRQRYNAGASVLSPLVRDAMSRVARHRAGPLAKESGAEAVLQLTGWYRPSVSGVLRASYHDGNLASTLQRPELLIDQDSRRVRRALRWERGLYDATDVIFTMSAWLREIFIESFGQPGHKVVAVGAGSDLAVPPAEVERDWGRPCFLFVGREWERKGGPELLRAWPAVRAVLPEAQLMVIGPVAVDEPTPEGVVLCGRIDRSTLEGEEAYIDIYKRATAFVLPSLYEPFGIVLLEAMAYGLPCVASDRCAMPEIVNDGTTGRIVDPTDSDALASALVGLADPEVARRLGEAGRQRLLEYFTWDSVAGRILAEIEARTGGTRRLPSAAQL
jgi:glycosyltransferase involved in cell wall biosynthesis